METIRHVNVPFELKAVTAEEGRWEFEGYAAAFNNLDRVGDVILPGAFQASLPQFLKRGFIGGLMHDWSQPIGKPLEAREDQNGLYIRARIVDTQHGRDCYELLKQGVINSLSIGFRSIVEGWLYGAEVDPYLSPELTEAERERIRTQGVRVLKRCELYEVSPVSVPANPQAVVTQVKGVVPFSRMPLAPRTRSWDATAAERRVRAWADAEEAPNARYRRAFFWYDSDAPDQFGSYKLQFADVIDGELHAVPRAIFAVAAVLQGARGGVDIPESDVAGVKRVVARWYARMAEEFDDDTIVPPWESEKQLVGDTTVHREASDLRERLRALLQEALDLLSSANGVEQGNASGGDGGGGDGSVPPMGRGGGRITLGLENRTKTPGAMDVLLRAQELITLTGGVHEQSD